MQFKHPEILYALFLLIIPIIVHLFQLRRFKKVPFTNVKFLTKVSQNTRKSSRLKKILILCTRLLALAALIIAFAQPFLSSTKKNTNHNTYLYVDNSFSMQAKGAKGELLKRAIQDIIETYQSDSKNINLITNNSFFKNLSSQGIKKELLALKYHPIKQDINTILFKIKNSFKRNANSLNEIILISDFQNTKNIELDSAQSYNFVQLTPVKQSNISVDSVYIADKSDENIVLKTIIKSNDISTKNITVSLFNGSILQGKSNVELQKNGTQTVDFTIPTKESFNGKIILEDTNLPFDNELYFSINKDDKINVLAIGNDNNYLKKIYTKDEFNFTSYKPNQIDYSKIKEQNLIVLNELKSIPSTLINTLKKFNKEGGSVAIIPNENSNNDYKLLFSNLNIGKFQNKIEKKLSITDINFSHPILKNVFEKQVQNFQYPTVNSHYKLSLATNSKIVTFENKTPFITQTTINKSPIYIFSSAISANNSNFKNSPLIVPIFYNFGKYSYKHSQLSYTIGNKNEIEVKAQLKKDDILEISNELGSFIPLQEVGNASVKINLDKQPLASGFYQLKNNAVNLNSLAFNYNRNESNLNYPNIREILNTNDNISFYTNVKEALNTVTNQYKTNNLWQLFLVASIVFLIIEMLLLKFFKP